jgi:hypothetical protein
MYLNPKTTEINFGTVALTPRHASGIRRAIEENARRRIATYVKEPPARRFQLRVKQLSRYLNATVGPEFAAPVLAGKRHASWVYVTPLEGGRYSLSLLSVKKTRLGVQHDVAVLPIEITAHCIDRLIQQLTIRDVNLPSLMFELVNITMTQLEGAGDIADVESSLLTEKKFYLATEMGLFVVSAPTKGPVLVKTFIAEDRLIEKRFVWESIIASGDSLKLIDDENRIPMPLAA